MKKIKYTSKNADKFVLYEKAVQNPDYDAVFVKKLVNRISGRKLKTIKEDFCGTFAFACEWVKLNPEHEAIGVDLDLPTLEWGKNRNMVGLTDEQKKRIQLKNRNVIGYTNPKVDVVAAFNFSYFIFKTRAEMKAYFRNSLKSLKPGGIFLLDAFGGSEAVLLQEEKRDCEGFTYVWDHAAYSPVTADMTCKIHFEFSDGSKMRNAFTYEWRLWTLPEIMELLREAGFENLEVYWEGTERATGEGNGVFRKTEKGEPCQSWIAYIAARKT